MYFYKMKTLHLKLLLLEKNQFNLGILFSSLPGLHVFRQSLFFIVISAEPRRLNSWPAESVDADTDWGCVCMAVMAKYKHRYQKPFQTASQGTDLRQTNTQIGSQCPSHGDKCLV